MQPCNKDKDAQPEQPPAARKLRLLCLHGFRQSASSFKGRTAALRRRLGQEAEFVFVDAPHELPPLARVPATEEGTPERGAARPGQLLEGQPVQRAPKRAWLLAPEQHAALSRRRQHHQQPDPLQPELLALMDEQQYQRQTAGWQESWACLAAALREQGPFDGVLGLSQGAAVAAALCALQQEQHEEVAAQQLLARKLLTGTQPAGGGRAADAAQLAGMLREGSAAPKSEPQPPEQPPPVQPPPAPWFRFAILCSGYAPAVPEVLEQWRRRGGIRLPSLHIYGAAGGDRQISAAESRRLAGCFAPALATTLEHGMGHLIPSDMEAVAALRTFLASVGT